MVRLVKVMVVAVTAVITLASPQAFNDARGGLSGPLVFVACYALIRLLHLGAFWLVNRQNPTQRAAVERSALPTLSALALLVAAALIPQPVGDIRLLTPLRAGLWLTAIAVDLAGNALTGLRRLRIWSAEHWADRYSLIIIIALGHLARYGGVIIYLLADHGFRWRLSRRAHPQRIVQKLVVTALAPATARLPALTSLATLAAVCAGFATIEVVRRNPALPEPQPVSPASGGGGSTHSRRPQPCQRSRS